MVKYLIPKFHWNLLQKGGRYVSDEVKVIPVSNRLAAPKSSEENVDALSGDHNDNSIRRNVQKKLAGLQDEYDILPPEEPAPPKPVSMNKPATGYRTFTASTTYKNVTLPLKSSKLANPFPEPVKLMPSHTVSDQEKADQMQAEFRIPKCATQK